MRKVLVTGVAGFIASKVAEFLLADGVEVVGIDNLNSYYDVRLKNWRLEQLQGQKIFHFEKIDIEDQSALKQLFDQHQFDVVFNLAARAGVRYSMENPHVYMSTNAQGSLNLLEEMRRTGVKKFILASTSSLYAGLAMPFSEELPVNAPISPYAASKKAAEVMAYTYHYLYGIDVSIVRYFTVFGPASRPDMAIFRFIEWIDRGEKIQLFGDGAQSRDFTYVDDIARGTILAAKPLGYEVINLGGGRNPISVSRVIEGMEKGLSKKAVVDVLDSNKSDMKQTWADIAKAQRLLGWKPEVDFEMGLERTIEWHRKNTAWLQEVSL
ncbi:GDP-mannose 4,6-dehydratase [Bdellovibrio svalbardensis]|uniref:GDP-mannose 4,6-dehydratase n=1 Tax=Bdellovibrio svalbardensis TaxID=2972972 RepID=A0ABT6DKA8_9BACT|nr:GDP-mannose 4,6-dehydratase [Bdellovibrio svalbardensis]MDG0816271.1 GDP-mannose 4,6-dehydratase [Bdellovibrio svalbardensis]